MRANTFCLSSFTLLLIAARVRGESGWTFIGADLQPVRAESVEMREGSVRLSGPSVGAGSTLPVEQLVELQREGTPVQAAPESADHLTLWLSDNQKLVGRPRELQGETLVWQTALLGDVPVPLRELVSMTRSGLTPTSSTGEPPVQDEVRLRNGDIVRGILGATDETTLTVESDTGPTPVPLDAVAEVRFARTAIPPASADRQQAFRLMLSDGTSVGVDSVELDAQQARLLLDEARQPVTVQTDHVVSIQHTNGPVSWLSDRSADVRYTPMLSEHYPPAIGLTVDGIAIRLSGQTYSHSIGMHARTSMTWLLDGSYATFRMQYIVRPELRLADAVVRVKVDDRTVHETTVRAGHTSSQIEADVASAKSLTLEVDYGEGGATQDRVEFIQPALLRAASAASTRAVENQ